MRIFILLILMWTSSDSFAQTIESELKRVKDLETVGKLDDSYALLNVLADTSNNYLIYFERAQFLSRIRRLHTAFNERQNNPLANQMEAMHRILQSKGTPEAYNNAIVDDLTITLAADSTLARAYVLRAQAYEKLNMPEAAMADYQRTINLQPSMKEAISRIEYLQKQLLQASNDSLPSCTEYMKGRYQAVGKPIRIRFSGNELTEEDTDTKVVTKKALTAFNDCAYQSEYISISQPNIDNWLKGEKEVLKIIPVSPTRFRMSSTYKSSTTWTEFERIE